jgi:hypothetical protein
MWKEKVKLKYLAIRKRISEFRAWVAKEPDVSLYYSSGEDANKRITRSYDEIMIKIYPPRGHPMRSFP